MKNHDSHVQVSEPERSSHIEYVSAQVPKVTLPSYHGQRYEATVPDTLDLAERAALAVNGLTGPTNANADYELYWWAHFRSNPPWIKHTFDDHVQTKFCEALPLCRLASGSEQNRHVEQRLMEVLVQMQGPDGLLYYPLTGRPWAADVGVDQGFGSMDADRQYAEPWANGRILNAVALYFELTGDRQWKELGEGIVDGLIQHAVEREDYAYFPQGICGVSEFPEGNEPPPEKWSGGSSAWICLGLSVFFRSTDYRPAMVLAEKLARFARYHGRLLDSEGRFIGENAWGGPPHFHMHTGQLLGLLYYAMIAEDWELIQFVRKGFEFAKTKMDSTLLGYTPEYIDNPKESDFSPELAEYLGGPQTSEPCAEADILALAIKLTRAGAGDYWDDVDRWCRNHLAESQLTSVEWVDDMVGDMPAATEGEYLLRDPFPLDGPDTSIDDVVRRCVGGFGGWISPNDWQGARHGYSIMSCCTGNATRVLYYVWQNILACDDGHLRVNLLLNRASPWADVDSYLPYEGRVDVRVKQECDLSIRIPEWVSREQVSCKVNDADCGLAWDGRYAALGKVESESTASLTFPIFERTEEVHIQGTDYTIVRKGNEVVHIDPPGRHSPLYQRDKYRQDTALWRKVERFVAESGSLDW